MTFALVAKLLAAAGLGGLLTWALQAYGQRRFRRGAQLTAQAVDRRLQAYQATLLKQKAERRAAATAEDTKAIGDGLSKQEMIDLVKGKGDE